MIRVATIGTSVITRWFAGAVSQVDGIELTCAYSRDPQRAAAFAADLGMEWSSGDLAAVLGSDRVDAVYVASPNALHLEHAQAALRAGKHVLVEKPATLTAADFGRLVEVARSSELVVMEAIRNVYDPAWDAAQSLLPRLGTIRNVTLRYIQRSSRYDQVLAGQRVNIFDPALGGGALYDLGIYCVHILVKLFGEPTRVLASSVPIAGGADGAGSALAIYPGFTAELGWSKITASGLANEIQGELGTLTVDHVSVPHRLTLTPLAGEVEEYGHGTPGDPLENMVHEVRRFAAAVSGEADVAPDQEQTLAALRTIEAIRAASRSGSSA